MWGTKRHSERVFWLGLLLILPLAYLCQVFPHAHEAHGAHHPPASHESTAAHHDHDRPHSHAHPHAHDESGDLAGEDQGLPDHGSHHHSLTDHLDSHFFRVSGLEIGPSQILVADFRGPDLGVRDSSVPYPVPEPDRLPPHLILLPSCGPRSPPFQA